MAELTVRVFAPPLGECAAGKPTWREAVEQLSARLAGRYGPGVRVEFVELFTPESFAHADIMERIRRGEQPPFIALGDEVIQNGGKISESAIRRKVEALGAAPRGSAVR